MRKVFLGGTIPRQAKQCEVKSRQEGCPNEATETVDQEYPTLCKKCYEAFVLRRDMKSENKRTFYTLPSSLT